MQLDFDGSGMEHWFDWSFLIRWELNCGKSSRLQIFWTALAAGTFLRALKLEFMRETLRFLMLNSDSVCFSYNAFTML